MILENNRVNKINLPDDFDYHDFDEQGWSNRITSSRHIECRVPIELLLQIKIFNVLFNINI